MDAVKLDPEYLHRLSDTYPQILEHIEESKPDIYLEGVVYCCLTGSDPKEGIFGSGNTLEEAVEAWEKNYLKARNKS